ncbi:BamA/TamA family outer membrane protein [Vibrio crassostreae]|uniref:BamA/TamA family outer membrane protein n=1 Tax=Vibrio crassostreae TaxID=246167 RepID=UPI001B315E7A|nr:BamA/TamA family outer membrane protein [Vibrio crassostreae]
MDFKSERLNWRWGGKALGVFLYSLSFASAGATPVSGKYTLERVNEANEKKESLILPYAFNTESMGFNVGVGAVFQGIGQEQMQIGASAYTGGDDSYAIGGGVWNYQPESLERLFISAYGMYAYYPENTAYTGPGHYENANNPPIPGSSGSSSDQYIQGAGFSNWLDIKFEYILPLGDGADSIIKKYDVSNGLLVKQPTSKAWNPLEVGTTTVIVNQFNRYQTFEDGPTISGELHGVEFGLQYDNTDFYPNPSIGSRQYVSFSAGGAILESDSDWNFVQLDASKYVSLGKSDFASQRILAFNFWTGYSPTWNVEEQNGGGVHVNGAAPYNEGANLGGWNRMRGYDSYRFHDKAALYLSGEYRYTLKYNPIQNISWLKFLNLDWFQLVGFVEVGEVADEYSVKALTSDMKFDGGVSLRAFAGGIVVRTDLGVSNEGANLWMMVNQPF